MRRDLTALAEKSYTLRIFSDAIHGTVEIGRLAVGREDVLVKKVSHAPLKGKKS